VEGARGAGGAPGAGKLYNTEADHQNETAPFETRLPVAEYRSGDQNGVDTVRVKVIRTLESGEQIVLFQDRTDITVRGVKATTRAVILSPEYWIAELPDQTIPTFQVRANVIAVWKGPRESVSAIVRKPGRADASVLVYSTYVWTKQRLLDTWGKNTWDLADDEAACSLGESVFEPGNFSFSYLNWNPPTEQSAWDSWNAYLNGYGITWPGYVTDDPRWADMQTRTLELPYN